LSAQAPAVPEDRFPPWAQLLPELQLSEYASWRDVEAWAVEHYQVPHDLSPELLKVAATIRAQAVAPKDRAARVLKFVQDEIRYFAIATGVSSHQPNPPDVTYARRYGDCKDKTLLTIALLQRLGIEARPALVSVSRQRQVREWLPTPDAFDHVITQAVIDGQNYWLDATKIHQASELSHLSFDPYGYALIVGGGYGELSQVTPPSGYGENLNVTERYSVKRYSGPIELTVVTHATTGYADRMRSYLASKGPEAVAQEFEEGVKQKYPSAKRLGDMEINDDLERGELTITDHYEVLDLFKYANGGVTSTSLYPTSFVSTVRLPEKVVRTVPMQLPFAATLKHQFELDLPLDLPPGTSQPVTINNPHFAFAYRSSLQQRHFVMQYELRLLRDQVMPNDMPGYLEAMTQVRRQFERQLRLPLFNPDTLRREVVATANGQRWPRSQSEWLRRYLVTSLSRRMASEAAIRSGQLEGKDLAAAWLEVAVERSNSSDGAKALEAIDMALRADPSLPRAHKIRAEVMAYAGDFKSALPEIKRALSLDKELGAFSLGQIQYYLGQHPDATNSFVEEVQRTSGQEQMYRFIWLYLAAKRSGLDPVETMKRYGYSEQQDWPGPIASYLLGATSEEALLKGAKAASNATDVPPRLCEAWFFIAQKNLIAGNADRGRQALLEAIDTKVEPYVEYRFSKIELERLPN